MRVGQAEFVQVIDRELIKVNREIHESNKVNVVFDILHVLCNGLITLLRIGKILAINHDPPAGGRGVCLLEDSPHYPRCGGGRDKLHEPGRDGYDNCIKKQLILLEPESIIRI